MRTIPGGMSNERAAAAADGGFAVTLCDFQWTTLLFLVTGVAVKLATCKVG